MHNAENDDDKQKLRDFFKTVTSLYDIAQIKDKLIGKQCWYTVEKSDETYINENGEEKNRYNKNFWGYEPTLNPKKKAEKSEEATKVAKVMDYAPEEVSDEPIDFSEIPF